MNYNEIKKFVDSVKKGQFGICIVAETSCDNKLLASGRDYIGRIKKVTMIVNARLGAKYESMVSAKSDGSTFTPAKLNGMVWLDYPYFKQSNKSGKIYLSFNYRKCDVRTKFVSKYLLDCKVASDSEIAEFTKYFKGGNSYSKKQAAAGIVNENEQTKVVQYDIEDIKYIGTAKELGEVTFERLIS